MLAAQFVRGVLLIEPDLAQVTVPTKVALEQTIENWHRESVNWHNNFKAAVERVLVGLEDKRTREAVELRTLKLLHAV